MDVLPVVFLFSFFFNKEERETDVISFPKSMHRLRSQDGSEERQRSLRDAKIITVNIVDGPEKPLGHGEKNSNNGARLGFPASE